MRQFIFSAVRPVAEEAAEKDRSAAHGGAAEARFFGMEEWVWVELVVLAGAAVTVYLSKACPYVIFGKSLPDLCGFSFD